MYILIFLFLSIFIVGCYLLLKGNSTPKDDSNDDFSNNSITYFKRKPYVESRYRVIEEQNLKGDVYFHIDKLENDKWVRTSHWNYHSLEDAKNKINYLLKQELDDYNSKTKKYERVVFISEKNPNLSRYRIIEVQYLNEKIMYNVQKFKDNTWSHFSGNYFTLDDAKKRCLDSALESEYNKKASSIIVSKKVTYEN